jgi:4-hydroxy-2-oxoheptanedioate aldolase
MYGLLPADVYHREANDQRFVIVQIEDPEPLDELEEIAALPGIDALFFGRQDFSQGIGAPAQYSDPRIAEAGRRIADAAQRNGKFAATTSVPDDLPRWLDLGYRFFGVGSDIGILRDGWKALFERVQDRLR